MYIFRSLFVSCTQLTRHLCNPLLDEGIECIPCKRADNTKPGGSVDLPEGRKALQMNPDELHLWVEVNRLSFSKAICRVLCLGHNPRLQVWGRMAEENDLGALVERH